MIKERILNKGDRFHYFLCSRCQTLQLADSVEDIGYFYSNYRVFQNTYQPEKKKKTKKKKKACSLMGHCLSKVKWMEEEAVRLNELGEGDQAVFYIRKRRKRDES